MKKQIYYSKLARLFISGLMISLCVSITRAQDLPAHWESVDIGDVAAPGSAIFAGDVFIINGSGADIWFTADAFHFAYQPAKGNCEISAYVASITPTAPDAKACVMIRETIDTNSVFAMSVVCPGPNFGTYFQRRPTTGAECDHTNLLHSLPAPVWLKLVREGNNFTAYFSEDGNEWKTEEDPVEIIMPEDVLIGLGVCAHNNDGSLCETVFENVVVDPGIEYPSAINELTSNRLYVYPNPVTDILTLVISENNDRINSIVYIHNILGQLVLEEKLASNRHLLNLSDVPQGLYFITLKNDQGSIVKKLIKK